MNPDLCPVAEHLTSHLSKPGASLRCSWRECSGFQWFGLWQSCFGFSDHTIPFKILFFQPGIGLSKKQIFFCELSMGLWEGKKISTERSFSGITVHLEASQYRWPGGHEVARLLFLAPCLPGAASLHRRHRLSAFLCIQLSLLVPSTCSLPSPPSLCVVRAALAAPAWCELQLHHAFLLLLNPAHTFVSSSFTKLSSDHPESATCFLPGP